MADYDLDDETGADPLYGLIETAEEKFALLLQLAMTPHHNGGAGDPEETPSSSSSEVLRELILQHPAARLDEAVCWAVFGGVLESVQMLVHHGADVNAADANGRTAAHWAAFMGHLAVLQWLQTQGADVRAVEQTPPQQEEPQEPQEPQLEEIGKRSLNSMMPLPPKNKKTRRHD